MEYKIVASIEFPDGHMEYVLWDMGFYGQMVYSNIDVGALFYNTETNGFTDAPVNVQLEVYGNPQVKDITVKIGDVEVVKQLLIGTKVFPIRTY